MLHSFNPAVHVRAKERIATLLALYKPDGGRRLIEASEAFRTIERPSRMRGRAFCTMKRVPAALVRRFYGLVLPLFVQLVLSNSRSLHSRLQFRYGPRRPVMSMTA